MVNAKARAKIAAIFFTIWPSCCQQRERPYAALVGPSIVRSLTRPIRLYGEARHRGAAQRSAAAVGAGAEKQATVAAFKLPLVSRIAEQILPGTIMPTNCSFIAVPGDAGESLMKLLRTTALTAALMTAAVPSLTTPANAWGWGWRGGWGWGGIGLGLAAGALVGSAIAASSYGYGYGYPYYGYGYPAYGYGYGYAPAYGYASYGYGYPAYGYGYGTGYYGGYGYAYQPVVHRHIYATARRHWRY